MSANAHELMHWTECPDDCPLLNRDVPCERGRVDQHSVIANKTVVPDVRVRHDESMAADAGHSPAFHGSTSDGHVLANDIVIAHLQPGGLTGEGCVLRVSTHHGEGINLVVTAQSRRSIQNNMRDQIAVLAQLHV